MASMFMEFVDCRSFLIIILALNLMPVNHFILHHLNTSPGLWREQRRRASSDVGPDGGNIALLFFDQVFMTLANLGPASF